MNKTKRLVYSILITSLISTISIFPAITAKTATVIKNNDNVTIKAVKNEEIKADENLINMSPSKEVTKVNSEENAITQSPEIKTSQNAVENIEEIKVFKEISEISQEETMFVGKVTHYGPDCYGCSGYTASGYNVNNTNSYEDSTYGTLRIVAAPRNLPLYSVIKIRNYKGGELLAIVLDRGGAIQGTKFDILVSSEEEAIQWGVQYGVEIEIIRWGK